MTKRDLEALIERARYRGPTVTADQLIGLDACLRQLGGQVALLARPELARRFSLEPSGTLFIGPPGTGKTLVARYLAGQLELPLYHLSADQFGSDPELIHGVFRRLGGERAILFIDEISILALKRDWANSEDRRMLAALLTSLDGLQTSRGPDRLWVIGACTHDKHLDPAIQRSGRLGVVIEFAPPSADQRRELFRLYLAGVPHHIGDDDIGRIAELANRATGADIADWVNQAASVVLAGAETDEPVIGYRELEAVVTRRGFVGADQRADREPRWSTAVHEAAHAVVAHALFGRDALAKVSVGFDRAPDGLGYIRGHFEFSDDWLARHSADSETWSDHVVVDLAGMCAEELLLGRWDQGAQRDVNNATERILGQLDAGDREFGPSRSAIEETTDKEAVVGSEAMRRPAWALVQRRFEDCRDRTVARVVELRGPIEALAHALLESSAALGGDEIVAVIGAAADRVSVP
jgi:ATP-dependent 26S proteasome regulatory subunit